MEDIEIDSGLGKYKGISLVKEEYWIAPGQYDYPEYLTLQITREQTGSLICGLLKLRESFDQWQKYL